MFRLYFFFSHPENKAKKIQLLFPFESTGKKWLKFCQLQLTIRNEKNENKEILKNTKKNNSLI